jgi:hypothetical protein
MDDDKRARKALAKQEKGIRYLERRYGPGAQITLNARTTLAHEYHAAGRTAEGIAMLEQAVGDSERLNGPDHRNTLNARMNLAFGSGKSAKPPRSSLSWSRSRPTASASSALVTTRKP